MRLGTVAAAKCCCGTELFDPSLAAAGGDSMSMVYLSMVRLHTWAARTVWRMGPFNASGQRDLMVQFFIDAVLNASTGKAMRRPATASEHAENG